MKEQLAKIRSEALAAFEALAESDYTAESWHAAKNFYDAAVDMKGGAYPQNAVTVAAWKLQDSIKELVKAPKQATANAEPANTAAKKTFTLPALKSLHVDKGIVAAAVVTLVGAAAGMTVGVIKALKNRK